MRTEKIVYAEKVLAKTQEDYIPASYQDEINKLSSAPLTKEDIFNIKRFANFYGYWYDIKKQTITVNGNLLNIYRVKNTLYFKNEISKEVFSCRNMFETARLLAKTKIIDKMVLHLENI